MNHTKWAVPAAIGAGAFIAGAGLGYILGSRRRKIAYVVTAKGPEQLELDFTTPIEEVRHVDEPIRDQFHKMMEDRHSELEELLVKRMKGKVFSPDGDIPPEEQTYLRGILLSPDDEIPEGDEGENVRNVFVVDGNWDYNEELRHRREGFPHVIHYDEFMNEESGYSQSTVTYYQGDDIMADETDVPIYDHKKLFGELKFGHGSGDPNVVYIRNDRLEHEWEVLLSTETYEAEVLGNRIEHSFNRYDKPGVPKFRRD